MTDIEQVFANYEYRMIKKRMIRGKKQGAKAGKWTNGTPPFPYVYNRLTKELEVDPDKEKIYLFIKKMFLEDLKPSYEIAWELNKLGFKTNRNAFWSENAVHRMLTNEVHLGDVVYGKTIGSGHKNKPNAKGVLKKKREEWIVTKGSHRPLKTEEEHLQIRAILDSRRVVPKGSRRNIQVLSKLLYCGKCGSTMSFTNNSNGKTHVKTCTKADHFGKRCGNSGMNVEVIYAQLFLDIEQYEKKLVNYELKGQNQDNLTLNIALQNKKNELKRLEGGIERLKEMYIDGLIDRAEMNSRSIKQQDQIQAKKEEIRSLEHSHAVVNSARTDMDRLANIKRFKEAWDTENLEREDLNKLAKKIIDRIELIREGNNIQITIKFL
jgi:site-specific DNA recombinase